MDKVADYILIANVIPRDVCHAVIQEIAGNKWTVHSWYNYAGNDYHSEKDKELDTQPTTQALQDRLAPFILEAIREYMIKFGNQKDENIRSFVKTFTPIRFNRYLPGTVMREHYDHIHSIFDGERKGIPILTILGILNEGYEGGELIFFGNHEVKVQAGDILIFPSNFMYPHEVKELTKGERYTFVGWAF